MSENSKKQFREKADWYRKNRREIHGTIKLLQEEPSDSNVFRVRLPNVDSVYFKVAIYEKETEIYLCTHNVGGFRDGSTLIYFGKEMDRWEAVMICQQFVRMLMRSMIEPAKKEISKKGIDNNS